MHDLPRLIRRVVTFAGGVVLIVLGLIDYHVELAAIVVGLVLIGALSGDELAQVVRSARGDHDDRDRDA